MGDGLIRRRARTTAIALERIGIAAANADPAVRATFDGFRQGRARAA